jgi:hypothetical protein
VRPFHGRKSSRMMVLRRPLLSYIADVERAFRGITMWSSRVAGKILGRIFLISSVILLAAGCQTNGSGLGAVGPGYTSAQQQYPCPTGYGGVMNGYLAAQAAQHGIQCPTYAPPQTIRTDCQNFGTTTHCETQ